MKMHRCMNEMNGKTQESNDYKQQLRDSSEAARTSRARLA